MKKTLLLLLVFIILGGGAYWYTQDAKGPITTVKAGDRNFAIKETDQIGKIFIADRAGMEITLDRKKGHWIYNKSHKVREDAIANLLQTIRGLEVKFIPATNAIPVIVKTLASNGIKVEIYDTQGENMKTYYVGGTSNDELATYMIMEDAEQPYAMHLPTMEGNLRTRYLVDGDDWRDRTVFGDKPNDIDFVSVEYPKQKNKSFKIERTSNGFAVAPFYDVTPKINQAFRKGFDEKFIQEFTGLIAETFQNEKSEKEAIMGMVPFAIVTVRNNKKEETSAKFYPVRKFESGTTGMVDSDMKASTEILRYNVAHSSGDFMLVQQLLFGKIFWSYESFFET